MIKLNKKYIGLKLKEFRIINNIELSDLSKETEIEVSKLLKIENGLTIPSLREMVSICNFFETNIHEFTEYNNIRIEK